MTVLAVDLAAKYSAVCLMDDDYTVLHQFDSFGITEEEFIYLVVGPWLFPNREGRPLPQRLVIEDLPHGLGYTKLVKAVCRLQGRIVQAMHEAYNGRVEDIVFVSPAQWRSHYPAMKRGTGSKISVPVAAQYGYTPPADLPARTKGKGGPSRADKIATDYCAAYLIARWAVDTNRLHGTYDVPGTSQYATAEIRKKDFDAESSNADD